jgi:mannose-6-phosphate isomerase-like protein (cupin superfamily)
MRLEPLATDFGLYRLRLADAATRNPALLAALNRHRADADLRRSHFFGGRFENLYVPRARVPEIEAVLDAAIQATREILGDATPELRAGFWFNVMPPGSRTSLHAHEEEDELMSAAYYLRVPAHSGRLILWRDQESLAIQPEEGMLALFPPSLPHEVEEHRGEGERISIGINIGPVEH